MDKCYNYLVGEVLMAAWLYYHANESLMSDQDYDKKYQLLIEKWEDIDHSFKRLITYDPNCTSLYDIKRSDYPGGIKWCALVQLKQIHNIDLFDSWKHLK